MRRNRERQPDIHPGGVKFHRRIDELFDFGEINDRVEVSIDFRLFHSQNRAAQEDVFATSEFGMKTCSDLEQASNAAADSGETGRRLGDARENPQQRAFAGAVVSDQPDGLAMFDFE